MNKLVMASAIVLYAACAPAFAQSTETPATTSRPKAEGESVRRTEQPSPARTGDPNTTGDSKVDGMDVPAKKGGEKSSR